MPRRLLWGSLALALPCLCQTAVSPVRAYREAHEAAIVQELAGLLAVPNVAREPARLRENAQRLQALMEKRGIRTRMLEVPAAPPVVFGELRTPGARQTITFYAHYDGQPVDAKQWASGDPFRPVLRTAPLDQDGREVPLPHNGTFSPEWRLYGRSASDDKGTIVAMLAALDALQAARQPLTANLQFFFEGEEEAGSPHLAAVLQAHRDLLKSDVWLICDGPVHQSRQ